MVTPVVAFYMLLDWDRMVANGRQLGAAATIATTVRGIARDINAAIAGFVRGQGTVCLVLGSSTRSALTLTGLNFGMLIGLCRRADHASSPMSAR